MKIKYNISIGISEVEIIGPKFTGGKQFFDTNKWEKFESKLSKSLKKDFKSISDKIDSDSIVFECYASSEEDGSYLFMIYFDYEDEINISEINTFEISKKTIFEIEENITNDAYNKLQVLHNLYKFDTIDIIDINDYKIVK